MAVLDAARTGGLAIQAGEAAVQVQLRAAGDFCALEHLLDQVNTPARTVEFIAEELVGRTGGIAETAMHAFAQDGRGFLAIGGFLELRAEMRLHGSKTRVQPAWIEEPLRIESLLQSLMHAHEHAAQRRENALR